MHPATQRQAKASVQHASSIGEDRKGSTSLKLLPNSSKAAHRLELYLGGYDQAIATYLVHGFRFGFSIRYFGDKVTGRSKNLNFHVSEQVKKACATASALRRIRRLISLDVMCRLYKAYILPHLEYCCRLLLGVGRGQVKKLEGTNNYILRTILGYRKHTPYNHLLNMAGIRTLEERP